jgi:hypothetical protein
MAATQEQCFATTQPILSKAVKTFSKTKSNIAHQAKYPHENISKNKNSYCQIIDNHK